MNVASKGDAVRRLYLILMGIMLVAALFIHYSNPVKDGDVFFHLKYGQYHVQHMTAVMDHSLYSWTPATAYSPYCTWAADVFLYALYQLGGWPLLFAFKYLCMTLPVLFVWLYARSLGLGTHLLTPFVLIMVLLSVVDASYLKPEIISLLFFSLLALLYFYIKKEDAQYRKSHLFYLYPPVFLIWVNMHGVVFMGLVLLAVIICGELINFALKSRHAFHKKDVATLTLSGLLSLLVTLINPYGINLHLSFFNMSSHGLPEDVTTLVRAYQPLVDNILSFGGAYTLQYWGIMSSLLAIVFIANVKKTRDWDFGLLLPNLFLSVLFLQIHRATFYWPAFWALSLLYLSSCSHLNLATIIQQAKPMVKYTLLSVLISLSLFFPLRVVYDDLYRPARWSFLGLGFNYMQPVQESAFLKKYPLGTKLFNTYNTGSFLLFDLFPTYKVFIDSRYFPYVEHNIFNKFAKFISGEYSLGQMTSEFDFDIALVEHSSALINSFLIAPDWKPAYYGIVGAVFVKKHIILPLPVRELDRHRFDGIKNLQQLTDVAITAQNLNDLESAAYVISSIEKEVGHLAMANNQQVHDYLSACQEGLKAYNQGDYDKALKVFWGLGFTNNHLRVNALLRQLINKRADTFVKQSQLEKALHLLKPVLQHHPNDNDVLYDVAIIAYMSAQKDQNAQRDNGANWRALLQEFLTSAPDHEHAKIAKQLLAGNDTIKIPPLILNSKIKNKKLRTF